MLLSLPRQYLHQFSRNLVLFALRYLPASDADRYRQEELPRNKKNNFARWLYFWVAVLPCSLSRFFAGGVQRVWVDVFLNLMTLPCRDTHDIRKMPSSMTMPLVSPSGTEGAGYTRK
jgi:hypothetical protein